MSPAYSSKMCSGPRTVQTEDHDLAALLHRRRSSLCPVAARRRSTVEPAWPGAPNARRLNGSRMLPTRPERRPKSLRRCRFDEPAAPCARYGRRLVVRTVRAARRVPPNRGGDGYGAGTAAGRSLDQAPRGGRRGARPVPRAGPRKLEDLWWWCWAFVIFNGLVSGSSSCTFPRTARGIRGVALVAWQRAPPPSRRCTSSAWRRPGRRSHSRDPVRGRYVASGRTMTTAVSESHSPRRSRPSTKPADR